MKNSHGNYLNLIPNVCRRLIVLISHDPMEREVDITCAALLSDVRNATLVSIEVLCKNEKEQSKFYRSFPWSHQVNCSTWRFSNIGDEILSLLL